MSETNTIADAFGSAPSMQEAGEEFNEKQGKGGGGGDYQKYVSIMSVKKPIEIVRFITTKELPFYAHDGKDNGLKQLYYTGLCYTDQSKCPNCLCAANKKEPKWKMAHLVWHLNHSYKDRDGKEIVEPTVKLLMKGESFASAFSVRKKQLEKYGIALNSCNFEMIRHGSGVQTTYSFTEIDDSQEFTLPQKLPQVFLPSDEISVEEDRAEAQKIFSDPTLAYAYLKKCVTNMLPEDDRFLIATRLAEKHGGKAPTAPVNEVAQF